MAIKRVYFEEQNFVLSVFYDKLTNVGLTQHIIDMNLAFADKAAVNELADCRYLTDISKLTGGSIALSTQMESGQKRIVNSKCAIVVDSDVVYGLAQAYATFSRNMRGDARVFRSMDKAVKWLEVADIREKILELADKVAPRSQKNICEPTRS